LAFHQLLLAARKTWLRDALAEALSSLDPAVLKQQIGHFVSPAAQRILAAAGIRDEYVFPLPAVLEAKPSLLGYYRLLLGLPRKSFYTTATGMGRFRGMETRARVTERQKGALPELCQTLGEAFADLVLQMSPSVTTRDVDELPLLTLGSYFQGRNNTEIGKEAIHNVFLNIVEVVRPHVVDQGESSVRIKNAAGRLVTISLASDPDVRIQEEFEEETRNRVAIEIKGGTDKSNAYNRAGEAEKSHIKAKKQGFRDFWTIIATKGLDLTKLRQSSPTTNSWFDSAQVLGRQGDDWEEFRSRLSGEVGIPTRKKSGTPPK
jgi:hypothetical protein